MRDKDYSFDELQDPFTDTKTKKQNDRKFSKIGKVNVVLKVNVRSSPEMNFNNEEAYCDKRFVVVDE